MMLISFVLFSCEDVIDVNVPSENERLVIEASINYSDNSITNSTVKLTLTSPFFDATVRAVTGAEVIILDITNNFTHNLIDEFNQGIYYVNFIPEFNTNYQLQVKYNNEVYESSIEQLIPTVPIDSLVEGDGTLFEGNEKEVVISFTDNATRNDYYLFDLDYGFFITSEDEFYQGNPFSFSYFYTELNSGDQINISIIGIDKRHYNYMNVLLAQTQETGNPFATVPVTVRGNIINTTNPENYPLGYFRISEFDEATIILD